MTMLKSTVILSGVFALFGHASATYAGSQWHVCQPIDVAAYNTRVHVKCSSSAAGGIKYFAVKSSEPFAKNFLAVANSALVAGKSLRVLFNSNRYGTNFGCGRGNCRPADGIIILR